MNTPNNNTAEDGKTKRNKKKTYLYESRGEEERLLYLT